MKFCYLTTEVLVEMSKAKYNYENNYKLSYAQKKVYDIYNDILNRKIVPFISPNTLLDVCGGKKSILIDAQNKHDNYTFNRISNFINEINLFTYPNLTLPNENHIKKIKEFLIKNNINKNSIDERICFDIAISELNNMDCLITLKNDFEKIKKYKKTNILKINSIDPKDKKFTKEQTIQDKKINPYKYKKNK